MNESRFVKISEAAKVFGCCHRTISRWKDNGKINFKQKPSGHFLYEIPSELNTSQNQQKIKVIYVRVSSPKQKDDLERQKQFLQVRFPNHKVINDIGSGLNFKRRGLLQLLQLVIKTNVEEIVISSKDRLCRFGFELIEWLCEQHNTKLVVFQSNQESEEQQFVNDVLSIIQIYTCKWNGKRRYTTQSKKNKITIDIQPKDTPSKME
jgi:predicted site-specific integrase-resolvase